MYDICCIGHITLDKVVTPEAEVFMAGGTSFYFSNAVRNMPVNYGLITALAGSEQRFADDLVAKGVDVRVFPSAHTVYFENIYSHNRDERTQRVLQTADSFTPGQLAEIDAAIYHLGPLLADDIPANVVKLLASKGEVSLDVQGYLRKVANKKVFHVDWVDKMEVLPYVHYLKANDEEAAVITGETDIRKAAKILSGWGVKEVIITLGSKGSLIYTGGLFYVIQAYKPTATLDATGCGDTYMAGYLYRRVTGGTPQEAGEFGAAMASLKIAGHGPFTGTDEDVTEFMETYQVKA